MSYRYYTFVHALDPRAVEIVDLPDKVDDYFYLRDGVPMGSYLPPTTELALYERAGDMLTDFIANPDTALYVSPNVQKVLADCGLTDAVVELLPFILLDKRGRQIRERYAIANALLKVPCLDFERSKYRRAASDPNEIAEIKVLCIREEAVPSDAQLFRLAELPEMVVLRSDLLEAFQQAGLTGLAVHPTGTEIPG
ncbi:hypothetical protein MXAN_0085 [Myxococcus xanthus DK 1622]|uniref:Uncharacterized protein n=1 Tax=Myxococcus xanthus (strain DK1622) TaxID=246197 RepID=Q1DG55_MYXXD|nr:hypothetical protein [Myxococcus xanthus]ABF90992.1 hypothetical protein MXAN_0085 [Myxococcus xanthus DK 1622]NOJ54287.1 hypothetical protein [Myxococcus xanthus]QPM79822.1 hypothetical protein I5Q59_00520 [Myxococcus xanthus]QVW68886.1 hypothetical protein JTM82_04810 [Myxococcus xanthus DZ2]QZZ47646.1 hypothetical protein MyxoNM_00420 [Myxococcus xanthus]